MSRSQLPPQHYPNTLDMDCLRRHEDNVAFHGEVGGFAGRSLDEDEVILGPAWELVSSRKIIREYADGGLFNIIQEQTAGPYCRTYSVAHLISNLQSFGRLCLPEKRPVNAIED